MLLGDCLEEMNKIEDKSIDMILCDLPFGVSACAWDLIIPYDKLWAQYRRIAKDNAAIVLNASQPFTSALVMSNPEEFAYEWIWNKNVGASFVQAKRMPMRVHENILVFCTSGKTPRYFPIMELMDKPLSVKESPACLDAAIPAKARPAKTYTHKYPKTIQTFPTRAKGARGLHPTQKPVELLEYLIKTYTLPGETVLDNCAGSGSSLLAARNLGRHFIGVEREKKYYDVILERLAQIPEKVLDVPIVLSQL